ncbi:MULTISPECIES: hypothetical protein [Paenibacillus]|uniref:hypothetical protein n=1 Tax=Paenibacillus TaxID=44249 RepID=UPI000B879F99|nr:MULTISPECIES: hypothetical protein [Paenibacillus]PRA02794.1 hypothetical protein CQ043_22190 [Paenibacillus sp. MYb63]PRA45600.1 hypothetical protein CQ061_22150 [Paenibacillus sp. MYb67]QZN78033.1 hypothetical protein K5K90_13060 [Paenibacillus sp. DR312]
MLIIKYRTPLTLLILISISITVFCGCMFNQQKEIVQKAEIASLTYFKETYGIDVEFTGHKFIPSDLSHTVSLTGYVKGNKTQEIFSMVDYDTYEVKTGSVPEDIKPLK